MGTYSDDDDDVDDDDNDYVGLPGSSGKVYVAGVNTGGASLSDQLKIISLHDLLLLLIIIIMNHNCNYHLLLLMLNGKVKRRIGR